MKKAVCLLMIALTFLYTGTGRAAPAEEAEALAVAEEQQTAAATGPALSIDTRHVYPGMEKSFAEGYLPTVSGGKATVVLPLLSEAVTDTLTCAVNLGDPSNSPFVYKNYQKQFHKTYHSWGWEEEVECYLITFSLALSETRLNGSYPVNLTVSGVTDEGEAFSEQFTLYVYISDGIDPHAPAPEQGPSSQPRLMVAGYALEGGYLEAGGKAAVTVTVKNTSSTRGVKNIKLSFLEESGEILPAGTGTAYCAQIAAGASYAWNLEVTATTAAQSRPHPAVITMDYEDSRGQAFSVSDRIILKVRQPVRLEYEEPSLPARVTQGDTPTFSMSLMNLGKSVIYNALLKFEIPGLASGGSVLVGTILPGESKTGTTNFRVDAEAIGDASGTLILSYEDDYGERYEEEIPLSTTIQEKIEAPPPAGKKETPSSPRYPRWIALAAGGAALLSLIYFLANRWLREKRAREDDEMRL